MTIEAFREIWVVDTEYCHRDRLDRGPVVPVCLCAREQRSGRKIQLWQNELVRCKEPPYAHGSQDLFVAFHAPAELSCYAVFGWPAPRNVLDLCIEYRQHANGTVPKNEKRDLVHALQRLGLSYLKAVEKEDWQKLVLTGGPFTAEQRAGILRYCMGDVEATGLLLKALMEKMPRDLRRALYRGRYTVPVAAIEAVGIPADSDTWERLLEHREEIQEAVIASISPECPVYEGTSFRIERFGQWLGELGLLPIWPRCARSTRAATDDQTFKDFSWQPQISRLREVRRTVQQLRSPCFTLTAGRNFFGILPFKAESSRNSTVSCLFQAPSWLRGLIQPKPGRGLVYADYSSEEFFVAAVLSGDPRMLAAYAEGDVYVNFAIMAGLIPPGGTKAEHPRERDLVKTALLAIGYGMKAPSLAVRLGVSRNRAEDLLNTHNNVYRKYWKWSDQVVADARWTRNIETTLRVEVSG